jgi:hypothetical protein
MGLKEDMVNRHKNLKPCYGKINLVMTEVDRFLYSYHDCCVIEDDIRIEIHYGTKEELRGFKEEIPWTIESYINLLIG